MSDVELACDSCTREAGAGVQSHPDYIAGSSGTSQVPVPKHQEVKITIKTKPLFAISSKEVLDAFWLPISRTALTTISEMSLRTFQSFYSIHLHKAVFLVLPTD